jgi:ATPase family AAA domain-containing protein 3A/B
LKSRATQGNKISKDQRNALNAILYRTGTESDQNMMVYASNQPQQFDEAIMNRNVSMEWSNFGLLAPSEQQTMIAEYIETYLLNPPGRYTRKVETVDIEKVVGMTEGFHFEIGYCLASSCVRNRWNHFGPENLFETVEIHRNSMDTKDCWLADSAKRATFLKTEASALLK